MVPGHVLHSMLTCPPGANARRLKSKHPFVPPAQQLIISSDNNIVRRTGRIADGMRGWLENPTRLRTFILDTGTHSP